MQLNVTWKNNAPEFPHRVYATISRTGQRKRLIEVAPGIDEVSINLLTLPNGPIEWPAIITVSSVNGSAESKDKSAQIIFNTPTALPGAFAGIMRTAIANRPDVLPEPQIVDSYTPSEKFDGTRPHFMIDGYLFQNVLGKGTLFDSTMLTEVPTPPPYNMMTGNKDGVTVLASNGQLYYFGFLANSETVWKWDGANFIEIANLPVKTNVSYRNVFNGADGKVYCLGGYGCVKNGKFQYVVFDPKTNTLEVRQETSKNYISDGSSFKGGIDYNGVIVYIDTTFRYVITIDTRTGLVSTADLDGTVPMSVGGTRNIVGGDGVVYFSGSNKEIIAATINTETGVFSHVSKVAEFKEESGYPWCIAQTVTGEFAIGFTKDGVIIFFDPVTRSQRRMVIPGALWITSIFRHDKGLTAITDSGAVHIDFAYQWSFDRSYEQSHIASTNHVAAA